MDDPESGDKGTDELAREKEMSRFYDEKSPLRDEMDRDKSLIIIAGWAVAGLIVGMAGANLNHASHAAEWSLVLGFIGGHLAYTYRLKRHHELLYHKADWERRRAQIENGGPIEQWTGRVKQIY